MASIFTCNVWLFVVSVFGCSMRITEACKEQEFVKVPQDGLLQVNPFKITSVTSTVFCSFDCVHHILCKSFVFLRQKTARNCLLSSDPNGGSSSEDSETFQASQVSNSQVCNHNKCQRGSNCVPSCSSPYYACQCPAWAEGFYCENLNPGYNLNSLPWKRGPGGGAMKTLDSAYETWCTNIHGKVYFLQSSGKWLKLFGVLKQISIGESGVWAVNHLDRIFQRTGLTSTTPAGSGWTMLINGFLRQVTSGNSGVVWGINAHSRLFYRYNGVWKFLNGNFKWASCGKYGCWAIRSDGTASYRSGVNASNPAGVVWKDTGGSFKQLDTSVRGEVYAVDAGKHVYTREGISEDLPEGQKWSQFGNRLFKHVSAGDKVVFGLNGNGYEYTLP